MKHKNMILILTIAVFLAAGSSRIFASGKTEEKPMEPPMKQQTEDETMDVFSIEGLDTAVFAGGCFWGVEGVFEMLDGVENVESGYSGGEAATAHYRMVGTGKTGHAESVRIVYDPQYISYEKLLEIFFTVAHDPTQLNYQGPDYGTEYRSAVFYLDEEQKDTVEKFILELENNKAFDEDIVTLVEPLDEFYPAEDYHQNFMELNPDHPYIVYWDKPKIRDLESKYPDLIRE